MSKIIIFSEMIPLFRFLMHWPLL